jgi:hypothetical protein
MSMPLLFHSSASEWLFGRSPAACQALPATAPRGERETPNSRPYPHASQSRKPHGISPRRARTMPPRLPPCPFGRPERPIPPTRRASRQRWFLESFQGGAAAQTGHSVNQNERHSAFGQVTGFGCRPRRRFLTLCAGDIPAKTSLQLVCHFPGGLPGATPAMVCPIVAGQAAKRDQAPTELAFYFAHVRALVRIAAGPTGRNTPADRGGGWPSFL